MDQYFLAGQLREWALMFAFIGLCAWGAYMVSTFLRRRHQSGMQKALLEKFATAHDFAEFMQSPAGQKYVLSVMDEVASPRGAILNSIRTGLVLLAMGAGAATGSLGPQANYFLHTAANILIFVGLAFLVSAAVSYFLARKIDPGVKE